MNPLRPIKAVLRETKVENVDIKTYTLQARDGYPRQSSPGQFNMLGYPGIGEAAISFSELTDNGAMGHTIRAAGMATRFIDKLEKGADVLIRGPYGRGWPMETARGKDLLLVAGGIGLAPIRPVIREVMKRRDDFGAVSVLFGARNEQGLIFTHEYAAWQGAGMTLLITVDEITGNVWPYHVGLITGLLEKLTINTGKSIAFVCGPEIMMRFVCRDLMLKGMAAADLYVSLERRMKCGVAQCGHCQHAGLFVCKDGPVFSYREVAGLYDGLL